MSRRNADRDTRSPITPRGCGIPPIAALGRDQRLPFSLLRCSLESRESILSLLETILHDSLLPGRILVGDRFEEAFRIAVILECLLRAAIAFGALTLLIRLISTEELFGEIGGRHAEYAGHREEQYQVAAK